MSIHPHPTKGKGWWQIYISHGRKGKKRVFVFHGARAEAMAFEAELRGIPAEATGQTLQDILGRFLDWYGAHRAARTVSEATTILPKVIKAIGPRPVALLRQGDYTRYKQARLADGVTRRTINCELSYLSSMLRFAQDELHLVIGDRPKLYTRRQTLPPSRTPLTPDEIQRLVAQLKGDKATIVMLYAICGLRRTEALTLRRQHVDLTAGLLHVTGKGDTRRLVPIVGQELQQRLEAACKDKKPADYLFPTRASVKAGNPQPYQDLKKTIKAAAIRAGIDKPVWTHLLRHSGATAAIQAGVGLRELQGILGHTDIRMTEIYTHLGSNILQTAAAKMATIHHLPAKTSQTSQTATKSKRSKNGAKKSSPKNS